MPIRGLLYFGKMYDKYITENHLNIYGKTLIKLPTPRYTVLYNGMDEQPAFMQLRLSDFFIHPDFSGGERHAPQELVDFIGYNPVIELRDDISAEELIADVLENIEIYQSLVDKNRETAEKLGSWKVRMKWLMNELDDLYTLKDISCR